MKYPIYSRRALCALGVFMLGGLSSANADVLAEYDFNYAGATTTVLAASLSTDPLFAATASDADVTASNITVGSGLTGLTYVTNASADYFQIAEGNGMSDGVHADGGDITAFVDTAYAAGDYIEFTLTAAPSTILNLDNLTFDFNRALRGTNDFGLRTSVDGFVSYVALEDQAADTDPFTNSTPTFGPIDLSGAAFQGLTTITFRIIFDDRANNNGGASATVVDDIVVNGIAVTAGASIWQLDGNGDWSTPANWSSSVPNAADASAIFSDALPITGPLTASLDTAVTLGDLSLSSAQAITVAGPSALTLDGPGLANISASAGAHEISADVAVADPLEVAVAVGSALDLSGALSGSSSVTNTGDGQLTVSGDFSGFAGGLIANSGILEVTGTGTATDITVNSGVTLSGEGSHTGTLNLAASSTLLADPVTGGAFTTGTLSPTAPVLVDTTSVPGGSFDVLNYSTYGGTVANDFVGLNERLTFADTAGTITATVAGAATSTWTGLDPTNPTFWDSAVSQNWSSTDSRFYDGDTVTFTDAAVGAVSVRSAMAPTSVTFSNTIGNDYTLDDITANVESISAETGGINVTGGGNVTINAKITGSTDITHSGAGMLTIGAGVGNDFVGAVAVNGGGTLEVGSNNFLGAVGNTITVGGASTLDLSGINTLTAYDPNTFIFEAGAILTNTGGNLNNAFSDQVQLGGNLTIDGAGRIDIQDTITVTGTSIAITIDNDTGSVIGGDNSAQSIGQWIVNDGYLLASRGTASLGSGASVTVNADGTLTGNTGTATDNGSGFGIADIGNAITLNGGKLAANQNNTTTIYSGTVEVTADSSIDPDNGNRTVVLSGTLTESGAAGDLTIGNGTTRIASTFVASGFTGDFIFNEGGNIDLENSVNLAQDVVIDDVGGNKQFRLPAGNSAEISGGITINESNANEFDLNVVDAADTLTVSGIISGSGAAGVTKTSAGSLILSGINTYTGNTKIWNGIVTLVDDAQLTFVPTTNGTSNNVNGATGAAGTLNLDGDIYLDLSGADTTGGNEWLLINDSLLTVVYGGTFSVNSSLGVFTETAVDSGVWEKVDGLNTWTFDEATGTLSLRGGDPYVDWAGGEAFDGDTNGDGVGNGLAFILGAVDVNIDAISLLPTSIEDSGDLIVSFTIVDPITSYQLFVEHSSDLTGAWTAVEVPAATGTVGAIDFVITDNGATLDVEATINAASGGQLFGRLSAVEAAP